MKKNLFAITTFFVLSLLMIACDNQEKSFMIDGLRYKTVSDSTAEVIEDESYQSQTSITIPSKVQIEKKVYGVTSIGFGAFKECNNLISIDIPSSVKHIGDYTFANCSELKKVSIPLGITMIGNGTFANCFSLNSINIPENITNIGDFAFYYCSELSNIKLPLGITNIGENAFAFCSELDLIIANSEDKINVGENAFKGCRSIKFKKVAKSAQNYDPTTNPIDETASKLKFNVLSNSTVEVIRDDSYENYQTINIPDKVLINGELYTVVKIGASAFYKFETLININLPSSIMVIEEGAFSENENLMTINVVPENSSFSSLDGVLYNKNKTKIVAVPGGLEENFTIPSTVSCIGNCSFYGCRKLTEIEIPENVSIIEKYAFRYCSNLKKIMLPQKLKCIEKETFDGCTALEDVYFPPKLKKIGVGAFSFCHSLTYLMIPPSVTKIESHAFYLCENLELKIWNSRYNVEIGYDAFEGCKRIYYE